MDVGWKGGGDVRRDDGVGSAVDDRVPVPASEKVSSSFPRRTRSDLHLLGRQSTPNPLPNLPIDQAFDTLLTERLDAHPRPLCLPRSIVAESMEVQVLRRANADGEEGGDEVGGAERLAGDHEYDDLRTVEGEKV